MISIMVSWCAGSISNLHQWTMDGSKSVVNSLTVYSESHHLQQTYLSIGCIINGTVIVALISGFDDSETFSSGCAPLLCVPVSLVHSICISAAAHDEMQCHADDAF